jgi:hypothetical protein
MFNEVVGIAIVRPKIFENKLDAFDVELITSENITPISCKEKGGNWIDDPTGKGCHFEFHDVIDISMDDIVFGRLFSDKIAPQDIMKTKEYTIKAKKGTRFQFDCGQNTHDLYVRVEHAPPPTPFMEKHYLKYLDMACKHPPKGIGGYAGVISQSEKGIAGSFAP